MREDLTSQQKINSCKGHASRKKKTNFVDEKLCILGMCKYIECRMKLEQFNCTTMLLENWKSNNFPAPMGNFPNKIIGFSLGIILYFNSRIGIVFDSL